MDTIIKATLLGSGMSFNSVTSCFYILNNTYYNEEENMGLSDTPCLIGNANSVQVVARGGSKGEILP